MELIQSNNDGKWWHQLFRAGLIIIGVTMISCWYVRVPEYRRICRQARNISSREYLMIANFTKYNLPLYTTNFTGISSLLAFLFPANKIFHSQGIAYDEYSFNDYQRSRPGPQWLVHPFPGEIGQVGYPEPWWPSRNISIKFANRPLAKSPPTETRLAFINEIHVVTDESFTDRHEHLKMVFNNSGVPIESIRWRFKWNRTTCNSMKNHENVRKILNMQPGKTIRANQCPIIMKHVEIWHDMASRQNSIGLILEDDPLFVLYFKEKLNRIMYTAVRTGALRINGSCLSAPLEPTMKADEWIDQEPMFVIGACFNFHDTKDFRKNDRNAMPILSTQKERVSRCAHAYVITGCTARALVKRLNETYTETDTPDHWLNLAFHPANHLQSFWVDPPLIYQGNHVDHDLDQLETFKHSKYNLPL